MNDEWMNEWVNEWMNEWTNEWMNEWMNEWTNEWMNGWINKWMNDWMNEWMNGCRNEPMYEWMNEWMSEWLDEWMNEWMDWWRSVQHSLLFTFCSMSGSSQSNESRVKHRWHTKWIIHSQRGYPDKVSTSHKQWITGRMARHSLRKSHKRIPSCFYFWNVGLVHILLKQRACRKATNPASTINDMPTWARKTNSGRIAAPKHVFQTACWGPKERRRWRERLEKRETSFLCWMPAKYWNNVAHINALGSPRCWNNLSLPLALQNEWMNG